MNSFGLGGSNAHAVVGSAASYSGTVEACEAKKTAQLLLYSANTQESLSALIDNYKTFIEDAKPSSQEARIAMVFTGQGAQWPLMGRDLLKSNPVFRSSIHSLDEYLRKELGGHAPKWSIKEELLKAGPKSRLGLAEFAQPLFTAVHIALVDTLRSLGIEADAINGHSSGEIAGAYAADALNEGEAIVTALYRGVVANSQKKTGAIAALSLSVAEAEKFLVPNTGIACDNSPRSVTISGEPQD